MSCNVSKMAMIADVGVVDEAKMIIWIRRINKHIMDVYRKILIQAHGGNVSLGTAVKTLVTTTALFKLSSLSCITYS